METTEFVLDSQGRWRQRHLTEYEVIVPQNLLDGLAASMRRTVRDAFVMDDMAVGISIGPSSSVWSVRLGKLPMSCFFAVDEDGVLTPDFVGRSGGPRLDLLWVPPPDMDLRFAVQVDFSPVSDGRWQYSTRYYWLAAFRERQAYRLPLGNLYADGRLCLGQFNATAENHGKVFRQAWEQFKRSPWNADLMDGTGHHKRMFRFQPNGEAINSLPVEGDWTALCASIGAAHLEWIVR